MPQRSRGGVTAFESRCRQPQRPQTDGGRRCGQLANLRRGGVAQPADRDPGVSQRADDAGERIGGGTQRPPRERR